MKHRWLRCAGSVLLLGAASACGETASTDVETIDIRMVQTDDIIAQVTSGWSASIAGSAAIDPAIVASLTAQITEIQFLPAEGDEEDDGAWVSVELDEPVEVNLMTLPAEGESPLIIASGTVAEGEYRNVRLFVDNVVIRFSSAFSLGAVATFDANVDYDVTVPSGAQTGIKTDAAFTVTADAAGNVNAVNLLFSTGSTFANATATGSGSVMLAPVIRGASGGN